MGLLTTVSSPSGLESSTSTCAPGTRSAWLSPLYSDGCSAVHDGGSAAHAATAATEHAAALLFRIAPLSRRLIASVAARRPISATSRSAASGKTTNNASIRPMAPAAAPIRS